MEKVKKTRTAIIGATPNHTPQVKETPRPKPVTRLVAQPNIDLALDLPIAEILKDLDAENTELSKRYEENLRMKNRIINKVLTLNAIQVAQNAKVTLQEGNILSIPQPPIVREAPKN